MKQIKTVTRSKYFGSALLCCYLIGAYGLAIITPLIWNEEYPCLMEPTKCALDQIGDLRPLYALVNFTFFSLSNASGNLYIYRAFGFIGFVLLHLLIFHSLRRVNQGKDTGAILFATMLTSSFPSLMTMAFSPNIAVYSWSTCLAIMAVNANLRRCNTYALLLATTSLLLYPPSTFFAFSYLFIVHLMEDKFEIIRFAKTFIQFLIIVIVSSVFTLIVASVVLAFGDWTPKDRVGLLSADQVDNRFLFFLTRFIPVSLRGPMIGSPTVFEALLTTSIVVLFLFFLIFSFGKMRLKPFLELTIAMFISFVASLTPFLLARPTEIDFRIIRNSTWLVWFSLLFLGFKFFRDYSSISTVFAKISMILSPLLVLSSLAMVNWRYQVYFHKPFVEKNIFILSSLDKCQRTFGSDGNFMIKLKTGDFPRYQNIGIFSLVTDLSQKWVPEPNVFVLAKQSGHFPSNSTDLTRENCLVDFNLYQPTKWANKILIKPNVFP